MKENFEQSLLATNEKINAYKKSEDDEGKDEVKNEIVKMGKKFVAQGIWSKETAGDIFRLQKEKNSVMAQLHKKIQAIEAGKEVSGFTEGVNRFVEWNRVGHRAMVVLPYGKRTPATVGELITDGAWGINYILDEDIPKDIKKRFVIAEARRKILELADEQIVETERKLGWNTYEKIHDDKEGQKNQSGFIAEKLVTTFFQKNVIDHNLAMKVEEVDKYEDVAHKIDFKIHRPTHIRGVGTDTGVQLTINSSYEARTRKTEQIKTVKKEGGLDVDDIVLVTLPMDDIQSIFKEWKENEMRPGGPIKVWDNSKKEQIFYEVLRGMFTDEEIVGMWESLEEESAGLNMAEYIEKKAPKKENIKAERGKNEADDLVEKISETFSEKTEEKPKGINVQEPRIPDEGGEANLNKFKKRFGGHAFISTRKLK